MTKRQGHSSCEICKRLWVSALSIRSINFSDSRQIKGTTVHAAPHLMLARARAQSARLVQLRYYRAPLPWFVDSFFSVLTLCPLQGEETCVPG